MRLPLPAVAGGVLLMLLGGAGLVRAAVPQSAAGSGTATTAASIVVTNAFVRPPLPPNDTAAAYFTVYNTTTRPDMLDSVSTGAGATAVLHALVNGVMTVVANGVVVPAHGSLVLSVGGDHVMIGQLYGPLLAGQSVNLDLTFANAGAITVTAPVVPLGQPIPSGSSPTTPVSSGASK